jgi:hypothetical protein
VPEVRRVRRDDGVQLAAQGPLANVPSRGKDRWGFPERDPGKRGMRPPALAAQGEYSLPSAEDLDLARSVRVHTRTSVSHLTGASRWRDHPPAGGQKRVPS